MLSPTRAQLQRRGETWTEFTFARMVTLVTRDRENNWPIADPRVPSDDPRSNCGMHFGSGSQFPSRRQSYKQTDATTPNNVECSEVKIDSFTKWRFLVNTTKGFFFFVFYRFSKFMSLCDFTIFRTPKKWRFYKHFSP